MIPIAVLVMVAVALVLACCKVAGDADQRKENAQKDSER